MEKKSRQLKAWDTRLNTKTPRRWFSSSKISLFFIKTVFSPHLKQLWEEFYIRFLNQRNIAFQFLLLFPRFIVDAMLAEAVTKLRKYKQFCFPETSLLAQLIVRQPKWSSIGESHHFFLNSSEVSETLSACNNCFSSCAFTLSFILPLFTTSEKRSFSVLKKFKTPKIRQEKAGWMVLYTCLSIVISIWIRTMF